MTSENNWPSGAVTFLFTDIEDSTPLWDRHRSAMRPALAEHDALLKSAVESNGGFIVKTTGDGVMAVFASPTDALSAALDAQRALQEAQWPTIAPDKIRVRMGLHTGEAEQRAGDYYGTAVNRAARLMSIGHGGQILLSGTTSGLINNSLADEITLLDLGEHHLKGLSQAAHIFQLSAAELPHDFPPLRTGETARGNLPQTLTSFVGREQELANIRKLLGETRLLTLTGPGGTGKTRLTLEAGHHLQGMYDHGVWLVELAPLLDGELITSAVAALFDLREQSGIPILTTLTDYLRGKKILLILDNCEHLVAASAQLAAELLPAAPQLTILASSREGLGAPGETTVHISALSFPTHDSVDPDEMARYEAVRLFVTRAKAAKSGFELSTKNAEAVGQIVRRLDGIPLAIELAAARVKLLSPAQIANRLDDRFRLLTGGSRTALPRQQTLRALIDWSYDLLDEDERWFLRQMAVFTGGWTFEAAEYVVEAGLRNLAQTPDANSEQDLVGLGQRDALDLLANLVNKSLVHIDDDGDEMRYHYLETIRQYARDKLYESGEGVAARNTHFNYFLHLSNDDFDGSLATFSGHDRMQHVAGELDNLRAALDWGVGYDPAQAIDLLRYLSHLWSMLALGREASRRAQTLLQALDDLPPAGDAVTSQRRLTRAFALTLFALSSAVVGGDTEAYAAADEAVTLFQDDGTMPAALAEALFWKAVIGIQVNQPDAHQAAHESYKIGRDLNNQVLQQISLIALARWELIKENVDGAAEHLAEARRLHAEVGNPILIIYQAYAESMVYRANGDFAAARRILEERSAAARQARHRAFTNLLESELGHTLRQSGDLAGALNIYRRTILEWQDLGHRAAVANQLENFAFIAVIEKQNSRAAQLFGAAEVLRETLSSTMMPVEKKEYDANVAALHESMDPETLQTAWQNGRRLDMDAAVGLALNERGNHGS